MTSACACGHAQEEHGHDDAYQGSTACTECDEDECVAFEAAEATPYHTTRWSNSATGKSGFRGTFRTVDAAGEYAYKCASESRSFASYEIWTGTPDDPGRAVDGTLVKGSK